LHCDEQPRLQPIRLVTTDIEPITVDRGVPRPIRPRSRDDQVVCSSRQFTADICTGRLPGGFCYERFDLSSRGGPSSLGMLTGDEPSRTIGPARRCDVLLRVSCRWPRSTPTSVLDCRFGYHVRLTKGLTTNRRGPHDRLVSTVCHSVRNVSSPLSASICAEFVTADLADLRACRRDVVLVHAGGTGDRALSVPTGATAPGLLMFGSTFASTFLRSVARFFPHADHVVSFLWTSAHSAVFHIGSDTTRASCTRRWADPPHEYRVLAEGESGPVAGRHAGPS